VDLTEVGDDEGAGGEVARCEEACLAVGWVCVGFLVTGSV
jgi:hypothetical protein